MEKNQAIRETRTVNVVYFLSRNGRLDHPHLIRIRKNYHNELHLHDVKIKLSELRGKEMSNSYVWSYKRRYRNGYVWEDVVDHDLITPISDNEYVLKGCQLHTLIEDEVLPSKGEMKIRAKDDNKRTKAAAEIIKLISNNVLMNTPPPPQLNNDDEHSIEPDELDREIAKQIASVIVKIHPNSNLKNEKKMEDKRDNYSKRISKVFQSCCTTNAVETIDAALQRRHWNTEKEPFIYAGHKHIYSRPRNGGKKNSNRDRPVRLPDCSHCGKTFRPEKLHSHMVSCKYLRRLLKFKQEFEDERT